MTPTPEEGLKCLRGEAKDWGCGMATVSSEMLTDAADLIESLTAERDGLAALVMQKDEALKSCSPTLTFAACRKVDAALAITLPEAVAQVQEWREKAELLDWAVKHVHSVDVSGYGIDGSWCEVLYMDGHKAESSTLLDALRAAKEAENAN